MIHPLCPFTRQRARVWRSALLAVPCVLAGLVLEAQVTDSNGHITSDNWLVLGPFKQGVGCGAAGNDLLANFIAPAAIQCEYPAAGDEIDYDSFQAASSDYLGPLSDAFLPLWRGFGDGSDDALISLTQDQGYECSGGEDQNCNNTVSWLVTYVEYSGPGAAQVDVCVGASDGAVLWLDGTLVLNRPGCTPYSLCQERRPVTIEPGIHRLALASFAGAGSWSASLRLESGGQPVVDGAAEWTFHGVDRPPVFAAPACPPVVTPVTLLTCNVNDDSGVDLDWENAAGAAAAQSISILADGVEVAQLPGNVTATTIAAGAFPDLGHHVVSVVNASGLPAACEVVLLDPVSILSCDGNAGGGVDVRWENPSRARPEQSISIRVNDVEVASVAGTETQATLAAPDVPESFSEICVVNASGTPACCLSETTDANGLITTRNWLVLGPFTFNGMQCNGREMDEDLLMNFIAPSDIACENPRAGDTIEYDPVLAGSLDYLGPETDLAPFWRILDDGTPDDGDLDLTGDVQIGASHDGLMSWLATYVEYTGQTAIDVDLCIGVDDAGQVWFDDEMVFNRNQCGTRELCRFSAGVTVTPGVHRIALGVFNANSEWGGSLALRQAGVPITDDPDAWPDWVFHGSRRPAFTSPCDVTEQPFLRGDPNADNGRNLTDGVFILRSLFAGGEAPTCLKSADTNDSGTLELTDGVFILLYLFRQGAEPPAPFDACGIDPTPDGLSCDSYAICP